MNAGENFSLALQLKERDGGDDGGSSCVNSFHSRGNGDEGDNTSSRTSGRALLKANDKSKGDYAGDIIWKTLLVALLSLIGLSSGFAFIFGLLSRDETVRDKVSMATSLMSKLI